MKPKVFKFTEELHLVYYPKSEEDATTYREMFEKAKTKIDLYYDALGNL